MLALVKETELTLKELKNLGVVQVEKVYAEWPIQKADAFRTISMIVKSLDTILDGFEKLQDDKSGKIAQKIFYKSTPEEAITSFARRISDFIANKGTCSTHQRPTTNNDTSLCVMCLLFSLWNVTSLS